MRFSVWPLLLTKFTTITLGLLLGLLVIPAMLGAEESTTDSDKETIKALLRRVDQLEARVAQLEALQKPAPHGQSQTPAPAPTPVQPTVRTRKNVPMNSAMYLFMG